MDDAAGRLLGRHADFDLSDARQPPEDFSNSNVEATNPFRVVRLVGGDGLGRLGLLLGQEFQQFSTAIRDGWMGTLRLTDAGQVQDAADQQDQQEGQANRRGTTHADS